MRSGLVRRGRVCAGSGPLLIRVLPVHERWLCIPRPDLLCNVTRAGLYPSFLLLRALPFCRSPRDLFIITSNAQPITHTFRHSPPAPSLTEPRQNKKNDNLIHHYSTSEAGKNRSTPPRSHTRSHRITPGGQDRSPTRPFVILWVSPPGRQSARNQGKASLRSLHIRVGTRPGQTRLAKSPHANRRHVKTGQDRITQFSRWRPAQIPNSLARRNQCRIEIRRDLDGERIDKQVS